MGMEYFGDKLKNLRKEKELTQQQLADKMELVKGSISAYYLLGLSDDRQFNISALTDEQAQSE